MKILLSIVLAAALVPLPPAFAQAPKKAIASAAVQKEFAGFIEKFRAALKANDPAAVAGLSQLPFMNDSSTRDAAQFREKIYKSDLTAKNRACIQREKAHYDLDGYKKDYYSIHCGDTYFVFTKTPAGFLFTDTGAND